MQFPTYKREQEKLQNGFHFVIGCDEVGVAPLAGPVVAAACIIDPEQVCGYRSKSKWFYRVRDSKTVQEKEREELVDEIKAHCLSFGFGEVSSEMIDEINIHNASLLAMQRAVENLFADEKFHSKYFSGQTNQMNAFLFLDGRFTLKNLETKRNLSVAQEAVVDGDALILSISAASVIAKVYRDALLKKLDIDFPQYGFARHKGYPTKEHREALMKHGLTPFHRRSFLKNMQLNF